MFVTMMVVVIYVKLLNFMKHFGVKCFIKMNDDATPEFYEGL